MDLKTVFEQFNDKKVLVIGDVMVDAYLRGKVNRISPEAPVPIVSLENEENRLGGAANVALNLVAMGAKPVICTVVGKDKDAAVLRSLLSEAGVSGNGIVESNERITTVKTRVIGNNQQLLRIDSEQTDWISSNEEKQLIGLVHQMMISGEADGIIFEDYNKGVLTERVIAEIVEKANELEIPTAVDPKKENFFAYKNVTLFKPNLKELKEGLDVHFSVVNEPEKFESAVNELEKKLNNRISFITLSENGVFIRQQAEQHYIGAHIRNIADVSGAGDTVISVATLCLIIGLPVRMIAEISNIAGGLVCEESGVVPVHKDQLLEEAETLLNF